MSANRLTFDGLEELRTALRNLPAELTGESGHIVEAAANGAAVTVKTVYGQHRRSGRLQNGVTVTHFEKGKFSAGAILKSSDKKAWLFDNGSEARHYITSTGKRHDTGAMWGKTPPTHVFVKTVIKARRAMYVRLKDLLTRKGLIVSGDA